MRVYRIENFISEDEAELLNSWADAAAASGVLAPGYKTNTDGVLVVTKARLNNRGRGHLTQYPEVAYAVQKRIFEHLNLPNNTNVEGGKDNIVVSITHNGEGVFEHLDHPDRANNFHVLRCNIVTRAPDEGGILHIGSTPFDIKERELHCYLVSKHRHKVTTCYGKQSRVLWMFGTTLKDTEWED